MIPSVVVDVGNRRLKWGLCIGGAIVDSAAVPGIRRIWDQLAAKWANRMRQPVVWAVAGVVPAMIDLFMAWANGRGDQVILISSYRQVPIRVDVENPESVGIDRLLGAAAAARLFPNRRLLVVDAGSAMTINLVDDAFRGGAILPGASLMARALHAFTAKLPLVDNIETRPFPGRDTEAAIQAGVCAVLKGAVESIANQAAPEIIVVTGGDGMLVGQLLGGPWKRQIEPLLNLNGLRLAAESAPHD